MLKTLNKDCGNWISNFGELIMNERHMQVELADYLRNTGHYDKVYVEYIVPIDMVRSRGIKVPNKNNPPKPNVPSDFPWYNQMRIDIMVEKDGKFAVVELKYATTYIDKALTVFGESLPKGIEIIKYQGAQDIVMYGYWKDVRRIEALTRFENMVGGVALIVSNDNAYWTKPEGEPGYSLFSVHENAVVKGKLEWKGRSGDHTKETYPAFTLDGEYSCHWCDTRTLARARKGNAPFRYMVSVISKQI